jgi:hypothetical protein
MPRRPASILLFLLLVYAPLPASAAFSYDPALHWRTLHSSHFEIHFHNGEQALAQKVAAIAEHTRQRIDDYFQWTPAGKTQVILVDRMDYSNGFSLPIPRNTMKLIVTPPDDITFLDNYDDYLQYLVVHEYTHIVHIDMARGAPLALRNLFGRFPWLFPNALQPAWAIEGIATYQESRRSPDAGRGNNTYYRGLMRNEVASGLKPLRQVNQPTTDWPLGTTFYLYGVYFFNYLDARYGDKDIKRWINEYSDNLLPFFVNRTSEQAFGKDLDGMWRGYEKYLQQQFQPDIERRIRRGLSETTRLSDTGYYTGYPQSLANGDVYYIETDVQSESRLMLLPHGGGPAREVAQVHGENFDVHPQQGIVLAQLDAVRNTNIFSDLYRIDLQDHSVRQITHGKRYLFAAWHPDGTRMVAVHNQLGNQRLDLLDSNGQFIETLWQGSAGEVIGQPQWSPDGAHIVASVWRPGTHWNLEQFDVNKRQWQYLTLDAHIETAPHFSDDGKQLLFSADYDGAFNIYQLELSSGSIIQLTNVLGGAMTAAPSRQDSGIYYMALNRNGYDLYYLARENFFDRPYTPQDNTAPAPGIGKGIIKTALPEPRPVAVSQPQAEHLVTKYPVTEYSALDKILPTSWLPYFTFTDERSEVGFTTFGADPLERHLYSLLYAYDFKNHWSQGAISYTYDRWNPSLKLSGQREMQSSRDSGDNLLGFTKSDTVTAELIFPILTYDRQWSAHLGYVSQRETNQKTLDPAMPNVDLTDKLWGAALTYNSARRYIRSISSDDGQRLRLVYEDSDAFDSNYKGKVKTLDWRGYFRLHGEQVLATRLVRGKGDRGSRPFRLGGTTDGYNLTTPANALYASTQTVLNRRNYALRGYPSGLTSLIGRDITLAEMEWRFPIARIERGWMAPPVGLQQVHGLLFYDTGKAENGSGKKNDFHSGAGVELNAELVLGYGLPLNVRMGYAHGYDKGGENQYYLTVGTTF